MEHVVPGLARLVKSGADRPFSIFGHSMGALVAYEVSRYVHKEYGLTAQYLFVSGMRAPHLRDRRFLARSLSDAELLSRIIALGGIPPDLWKHPELVNLMLQTIRADIDICERYRYEEQTPLAIAIEAFGGHEDPYVSLEEIRQWKSHTVSSFNFTAFEGGHFFIFNALRDVAGIISSRLSLENGEN
jgi:surfactin synthase thioesterase subunit